MAKYQHVNTGQVVEVLPGSESEHWTPDNLAHDPEFAKKHPNMWQPKPWFKWKQWTPVHDSTPVTEPKAPEVVDEPAKVTARKYRGVVSYPYNPSLPYPVGMLVYAKVSDLTSVSPTTGIQWMSAAPDNAAALIRRASDLVTEATQNDTYYTYPLAAGQIAPDIAPCGTAQGMPVLPYQAQAFVDATCQQVVEWASASVNPDAGLVGQPQVISQQSVPGGAVTYEAAQTQDWQQMSVDCLCKASYRILRMAGLAVNRPYTL